MATKPYISIEDSLPPEQLTERLADFCRDIARTREDDVNDFTNLPNVFMRGRKVGKIPSNSADVTDGDRIGDFNYATSGGSEYLYVCVDVGGTTVWRRAALGSF